MSSQEISSIVTNNDMSFCINSICLGSDPSNRPLLPLEQIKDRLFDPQRLTQFSLANNCWFKKNFCEEKIESGSTFESALRELAGKVEIEGKYGFGPQTISGSLNATYNFSSAQSEKVVFAVIRKICIFIELTLPVYQDQGISQCLTDTARHSLFSISNRQQADAFIDRYGTYFYQSTSFGGLFTFASTDVTTQSKEDSAMKLDLKASYSGVQGSVSCGLETAQSSAQERIGQTAKITINAYGGDVSLVLKKEMDAWFNSTINSPAVVGYRLCPIFELLNVGLQARNYLEPAIREYIYRNSPYEDILKNLESKRIVYMRNHRNKNEIRGLFEYGRDYTNRERDSAQSWIDSWSAFADRKRNEN